MKLRSKWLKIIAYALAGVVMITALIYYNFIDKAVKTLGVGSLSPEFSITVYDRKDGQFQTREKQVAASEYRGKVLIVNFWSTTCGSCMEEMPHFDEFQKDYMDDVTVVALGNELGWSAEKMGSWMNARRTTKGMESSGEVTEIYKWDTFDITFANYTDDNDVGKLLGFSGIWPSTAIIDQKGFIVYTHQGVMSYEDLQSIVDPLLTEK
ncbi:MAG: TlpA family protein disulfide reductase [Clostridia bacterium]|nr:TlpA family protein disulfide reductase [Clostridia bacterium]